jgi:hypothetical protein
MRAGFEDRAGITAGAERPVDDGLSGARLELVQDFLEKDRNVADRSATGATLRAGIHHHSGPSLRRLSPTDLNRNNLSRT